MFPTCRIALALTVFGTLSFAESAPGIKNFDRVDAYVYRGGQPSTEGFQYLAKLGVKTIIDLRESGDRSKAEEHTVSGVGMRYINVPMSGLTPPTDDQIRKILSVMGDAASGPVFVHCMRGADRTGAVIAAYHIQHDKWDNDRALTDAKAHSMSFFQLPRQSFIRNFKPVLVDAESRPDANAKAAPATAPASSTP